MNHHRSPWIYGLSNPLGPGVKIVHESIRARSVKELQQDGNTAIEPGRMDGFFGICLLWKIKI